MSGGAYDYAYEKVDAMADLLLELIAEVTQGTPGVHGDRRARQALAERVREDIVPELRLLAVALREIEWNDSGDGAQRELEAIQAVVDLRRRLP